MKRPDSSYQDWISTFQSGSGHDLSRLSDTGIKRCITFPKVASESCEYHKCSGRACLKDLSTNVIQILVSVCPSDPLTGRGTLLTNYFSQNGG